MAMGGEAMRVSAYRGGPGLPDKREVLGVGVSACDDPAVVVRAVLRAARERRPFLLSALSVHALATAAREPLMGRAIARADVVTTDGQPVRWAMNRLHRLGLARRLAGPDLMLAVCEAAAREGLPIYLYGSLGRVLLPLGRRLRRDYPTLDIAGAYSPRMRPRVFPPPVDEEPDRLDVERIRESGARMCFVGLGCPLQEIWAAAHVDRLGMPVLCVGAAFDFHAGLKRRPPPVVQRLGLEWLYRLLQDPGRLWRRYLDTNAWFVREMARAMWRGRGRGVPAG